MIVLIVASLVWVALQRQSGSCTRTAKLALGCGTVLGVATNPSTVAQLGAVEKSAGRPFGIVYRFHDLDDVVPTPDERQLVKAGRILHLSIDPRIYGSDQTVPLSDVTAGRYDASLTKQARGIQSLKAPVFLTFDHEPDQVKRAAGGSAADFIAAWRHVHDLYARLGVRNVEWVWVVTGDPSTTSVAATMWPGNSYVDWISWEAYNTSGCHQAAPTVSQYKTFAAEVLPFYQWLKAHGRAAGIDIGKPMMISEAGSVVYPDDPAHTASWYEGIPPVARKYPQIRAITLWDRPGNAPCEYQFDAVPSVVKAVGVLSRALA